MEVVVLMFTGRSFHITMLGAAALRIKECNKLAANNCVEFVSCSFCTN